MFTFLNDLYLLLFKYLYDVIVVKLQGSENLKRMVVRTNPDGNLLFSIFLSKEICDSLKVKNLAKWLEQGNIKQEIVGSVPHVLQYLYHTNFVICNNKELLDKI